MSRTVINLDDDLIARARRVMGVKRKVDIVNKALEEFVQIYGDEDPHKIAALRVRVKDWLNRRRQKG